jgi:hypothetical protein
MGNVQHMWREKDCSDLMILMWSIPGSPDMSKMASLVYRYVKDADVNQLFPPVAVHKEEAQADLNAVLASDPAVYGFSQSRWTLGSLLSVVQVKGYRVRKIGSLHAFLTRLHLRLVRARYALRSPDPFYQAKLDYIEKIKKRVKESQGREVALYLDECN